MLDIEVAGAIAPAANIVVYFAPNTDAGFLDAVTTAIHDTDAQAVRDLHQLGRPRVRLDGAGDDGVGSGVPGGGARWASPSASHPAITVRATASSGRMSTSRPRARTCSPAAAPVCGPPMEDPSETVWNDGADGGASGGGVSGFFPLPTWQQGLQATNGKGQKTALANRGVPDVSGDADPQTGYVVRVDGQGTPITGRPPHRTVRAPFPHTACMGLSLSMGITPFLSSFVIPFFCSTRAASILPPRPHISIAVARSGGQGRRFFSAAEGSSLTDASTAAGCRRLGGWPCDDPRGACHWPRSIARTTLVFGWTLWGADHEAVIRFCGQGSEAAGPFS